MSVTNSPNMLDEIFQRLNVELKGIHELYQADHVEMIEFAKLKRGLNTHGKINKLFY